MSKKDYFYGTGRRKTSSARVFLKSGTGLFSIKSFKKLDNKEKKNKKTFVDLKKYFVKSEQIQSVLSPLQVLNLKKSFDVFATVKGGGFAGQAEAIRHGLARALLEVSSEHRAVLKENGFLTRDPRMVERKKYGHHKARKSTQFSKR
ncbi:MAG: 30S ribosomal protein S9 [Oligoflexia bacterium]|nr:30S ribosomal protein S9 [Oligoflexia bacterium]